MNNPKLHFQKLQYGNRSAPAGADVIYLNPNNWDDFGFKTQFAVTLCRSDGDRKYIGEVKIGFVDQPEGWTAHTMPEIFEVLPHEFFSVGQSEDFYANLMELTEAERITITAGLRDVAAEAIPIDVLENQKVFHTSLLRGVSYSSIGGQFRRILEGGALQTPYDFVYKVMQDNETAGIELQFTVETEVKPSTNIHVLIGRNGIGKTSLLNGMISALVKNHPIRRGSGVFWDISKPSGALQIDNDFFTALVSVSFSAFDPFTPPPDNNDPTQHIKYSYVGLKTVNVDGSEPWSEHKEMEHFADDFVESLGNCLRFEQVKKRWVRAIRFLESDENFAEMNLTRLAEEGGYNQLHDIKDTLFKKMSSGHAIVLLTMTKLVERVEEKTLVLMDEPESHLHPPLLSAFTRALADLLTNRNGVAIIATHSPVVLQEVPKRCVWKLRRNRLIANADRPVSETFGENVGVLTREVFNLEVDKSGFHNLLAKSVADGGTFDAIVAEYRGQIGFEGRAILRSLIATRDSGV
ncbi:putative ATPase [Duganella sp. 1411]|uniref:AAA family ATPase n=1 Tax=Duganella sp. 1411 TaxID=2806572 RepID=UPI001AEAFF75|nr:AAA family ATPase [Duganella sp. 1411]MBP1205786.1 putative ATPase [Duganella sp. 1411]